LVNERVKIKKLIHRADYFEANPALKGDLTDVLKWVKI
jgi:hypothetical protein